MTNLDQRGLTPLVQDRTIQNIRAIEKAKRKENKAKGNKDRKMDDE